MRLTQGLFHPLQLVYIGAGAEPLHHTTLRILHRLHASQKHAEPPVRSAQRELHLKRLPGENRPPPPLENLREHLGVMHALPAPAYHLLRCRPRVIMPALVVPEDVTVSMGHPRELRDGVGHCPKLILAFAERRFAQLSGVDVQEEGSESFPGGEEPDVQPALRNG